MDEAEPPLAYPETPSDGEWVLEDGGWTFYPAPGFVDPEA